MASKHTAHIDDVNSIRVLVLHGGGDRLPQRQDRVITVAWCPVPGTANQYYFGSCVFNPSIGTASASASATTTTKTFKTPEFSPLISSVSDGGAGTFGSGSGIGSGIGAGTSVGGVGTTGTASAVTSDKTVTITADQLQALFKLARGDTEPVVLPLSLIRTLIPLKEGSVAAGTVTDASKTSFKASKASIDLTAEELAAARRTALTRLALTPCTITIPDAAGLDMTGDHIPRCVFEYVFTNRLPVRGSVHIPGGLFSVESAIDALAQRKIAKKQAIAEGKVIVLPRTTRKAIAADVKTRVCGVLDVHPVTIDFSRVRVRSGHGYIAAVTAAGAGHAGVHA